jgi:hypothetical protein
MTQTVLVPQHQYCFGPSLWHNNSQFWDITQKQIKLRRIFSEHFGVPLSVCISYDK